MPQGTATEYGFTAGLPRDFDPIIYMLSREFDLVLQGRQPMADGMSALASEPAFEKKVEWQDEEILIPRSNLSGSHTAGQATIVLNSDAERLKFQTGDVIKIGDEHVLVTGYNATAATLDVTRGFQGTTAATHADGDAVKGLGAALAEGSDPQEIRSLDRNDRHNFTQIWGPVEVKVSGSRQATRRFGVSRGGEYNKQAGNRLKELLIHREQSLIYGIRFEDTSTEKRTQGGFEFFITVHEDSTTTSVTYSSIRTLLQSVYNDGGRPNRLLTSPPRKVDIDDFDSGDIRLQRVDTGRGQTVEVLVSSFGVQSIIMSREVDPSDLFLFQRDQAKIRTLRPFQFKPLAVTGDAVRGMWVGESSLEFKGDRHAARMSALT